MASKKVSDQILLFEAANFKGTPKQFATLASRIKKSFPKYNGDISALIDKSPLMKNHTPNPLYNSYTGFSESNFEY